MAQLTLSQPHWEALTPSTREAFGMLPRLSTINHYYLAGETGLALHFGHRISVDLDLFSEHTEAVDFAERAAMREIFDDPTLSIIHDKDATFVATWREVEVSFFRLQPYPLARPTLLLDGVNVASVEEIGAMKLAAIIGRETRKDFIDLYFILQQVSLEALFEVAAVKYVKVNSFAVSATRAMAYFEDAEALPMPNALTRVNWSKIKKFLNAKALEAGRKHLDELWH